VIKIVERKGLVITNIAERNRLLTTSLLSTFCHSSGRATGRETLSAM